MKKLLLLLTKDEKGFTLVEIIVASGLLGVLTFAVMQMNQTMMKGQATAEVKMEAIEIKRQILSNMSEKLACENTLVGVNLGQAAMSIKNKSNADIFSVGMKYGAN
jgi:prepilin-type N-terminal cleavage/methylation domain-containing protein